MNSLLKRWFLPTAGGLVALTGLAKTFSAIGPARALDAPDPIFGIPFRHLMLGVGLLELLIAFFCLFTEKQRFCLVAVAWLSTNFLVYRLGLWWMGWHRPCGCLGNLTDLLHISPGTADNVMKVVLGYLLLGSYWLLSEAWRHSRTASKGGLVLNLFRKAIDNMDLRHSSATHAAVRLLSACCHANSLGTGTPSWLVGRGAWMGQAILLLLLTRVAATVHAAEFEVEGQLRIACQGEPVDQFEFLVRVDELGWSIRADNIGVEAGRAKGAWRRQTAWDGRDYYVTTEFLPSAIDPDKTTSTNLLYGTAMEADFPAEADLSDRVLWLAFCSGRYLAGHTDVPSIRAPSEQLLQPVPTTWEQEGLKGIPGSFQQRAPGYFTRKEGNTLVKHPHVDSLLREGWVDFHYRASGHTDIDGTALPLGFEAGVYVPMRADGSNTILHCATAITGWVSRAASLVSHPAPPPLSHDANLFDYRFKSKTGRPLMYADKAGNEWLRRNDSALTNTIAAKQKLLPSETGRPRGSQRKWVAALLFLTSSAPVFSAIALWRWRRSRKQ